MLSASVRKLLYPALGLAVLWLAVRYLLPVLLPFILGALLALAAEPAVSFCAKKLRLPRGLAAGLGVSLTLILLLGALSLLGALLVRELGTLASAIPDVTQTAQQGISLLQDWLIGLAGRLPDTLGSLLTGSVLELFGSGSAFLGQIASRLPGLVASILGWLPDGALGLGTGIIAGFMISSRLPKLRQIFSQRLPKRWQETYVPALKRVRHTLGGWLKAQLKLSSVTFLIVSAGLLVLRIPYGLLWALPVALVDAVPLLGTGTILLPWALICLLQGNSLRALGLVITYAAAMVTRTVLEPRLVGRQIGLDPLVTLLAMYAGYRFFGFLGLLLAPMVTAAAKTLTAPQNPE